MKLQTLILFAGMLTSAVSMSATNAIPGATDNGKLAKQVGHELNMLPYVNVFDYLTFNVDANHDVTLIGEVTSPVVKNDAANVVKQIEGVEHVDNQIQVLRVSPMDDQLRMRLFRTIYGYPGLQKYSFGRNQSIRIIVDRGNVTLMGVVDNQMDKDIAGIRANGIPGVFSVDNRLKVVKG